MKASPGHPTLLACTPYSTLRQCFMLVPEQNIFASDFSRARDACYDLQHEKRCMVRSNDGGNAVLYGGSRTSRGTGGFGSILRWQRACFDNSGGCAHRRDLRVWRTRRWKYLPFRFNRAGESFHATARAPQRAPASAFAAFDRWMGASAAVFRRCIDA